MEEFEHSDGHFLENVLHGDSDGHFLEWRSGGRCTRVRGYVQNSYVAMRKCRGVHSYVAMRKCVYEKTYVAMRKCVQNYEFRHFEVRLKTHFKGELCRYVSTSVGGRGPFPEERV